MKTVMIILAAILGSQLVFASGVKTGAEAALVIQCVSGINSIANDHPEVCAGIKTPEELNLVVACAGRLGTKKALACKGVKTKEDMNLAIECAGRLGDFKAAACGE